jgi:hypothetical protein
MTQEKATLAGMIGPATFALVVVVLTLVQYDFMVGLGWHPVRSSDVPWPSGLALGPLGWLQDANFLLFGLTLIAFAVGLHRGVARGGRGSSVGPALLVLAGEGSVRGAVGRARLRCRPAGVRYPFSHTPR